MGRHRRSRWRRCSGRFLFHRWRRTRVYELHGRGYEDTFTCLYCPATHCVKGYR